MAVAVRSLKTQECHSPNGRKLGYVFKCIPRSPLEDANEP